MKISDFIEVLKSIKERQGDLPMIVSRDPEGNGFSPFADWSIHNYRNGEIGLYELTAENIKDGYAEKDVIEGEKSLILWP